MDGLGMPKDTFSPNEYITTAQIGTIISRMLRGDTYNTANTCWYCGHLSALQDAGIMHEIAQPERLFLR
ncbi:MAG: hypothetical protein H6765_02620 [Candidatus Peribacteria bacterium]|nr:MAG: hypothetical protein H6765_02620 [Candidatus Peribacteria bacterium]